MPKMKLTEAKRTELLEVVSRLRDHDHLFLNENGVKVFSKPFGFTAKAWLTKANPEDFKGLTLDNGAKQARGRDASSLAMEICEHMGVKYPEKFGRGTQLQVCCDALEDFLKK